MSKFHSIDKFRTPEGVQEAIESGDDSAIAGLSGALGAVEKGGRAVMSDESTSQSAGHYWRVLNGKEKQKLGKKDYEKISKLISGFLKGPHK